MGYTNETTHYGIPLPTGSDLTTPMDYNEAMQDVDTALFAAKSDSDTALSKAEDLEVALGQTNDDLTALAGRVTTAEGTISDQGLALTGLGNRVDDNYRDVTDAICAYKEASATASRNYAIGDYFWYNDVLYKATTTITSGQTIVPDTNCTTTNVATELRGDEVIVAEITADGVKTISQILDALYDLIPNKTDKRINLVLTRVNGEKEFYHISKITTGHIFFSYTGMNYDYSNSYISVIDACTSGSKFYAVADTTHDYSSTVDTLGNVWSIEYL